MPAEPRDTSESARAARAPGAARASGPTGLPAIGYDDVPYPARAFPASHPAHLATLATLLGLRPPPLEECRVLELGCATGGNLIPMADDLPSGRFVGLDQSRVQIETARATAGKAGSRNVEFRCQNLLESRAPGTPRGGPPESFDYIIAHGLYSWVPATVRDRLLEVCARHLAPGGIAFVSYNTYPGWYAHAAVREMMLTHVWGAGAEPGAAVPRTAAEVLAKAREALEFLSRTDLAEGPYGAVLKEAAATVLALPDANLLHDHLGPINQPSYVSHFLAHAAGKGLRYLGDAEPRRLPGERRQEGQSVQENGGPSLSHLATSPLRAEQFADVLRNRSFRQSLLCRADAPPQPLGEEEAGWPGLLGRAELPSPESAGASAGLDPRQVRRLFAASAARPAGPETEFGTPSPETFTTHRGAAMTVADPLLKAALRCLGEAWPARLPFDALLDAAWRRMGLGGAAGSDTGADRLAGGLLQGFLGGVVELSIRPARCAARLSARPVARPLARVQAEADDTVTTLRHENLRLNATARHLLLLLDGTRDFTAIASAMARIVQDNARNIDPSLTLTEEDRRQLARGLQQDLHRFLAEGVLIG